MAIFHEEIEMMKKERIITSFTYPHSPRSTKNNQKEILHKTYYSQDMNLIPPE
jgi:hypothetical protein